MTIKKNRYCYSCDLKDNPKLIAEYKEYHAKGNAWPEVTKSIKDAGIIDMEIYIIGNRMFMIVEVDDSHVPGKKSEMDASNPKVQEWEKLMWKYQQKLPWAKEGEKWVELEQIFKTDFTTLSRL
jgi:L-rhamnose mutarotase